MDQALILPSTQWYRPSVMAVSGDGWVVYGGPGKCLCVGVPIPSDEVLGVEGYSYRVFVQSRPHFDKVVCVDITPEWPSKRAALTGGSDGYVKQWIFEMEEQHLKIKSTNAHDVHSKDREDLIGVGYSSEQYAISVGSSGVIVKWNLSSNITKTYKTFLKSMKPTSMSCSHHQPLTVGIGTKQGIIFVVNLIDNGKLIYKVRGHEDEIVNLSWCPQYEVIVKKALKDSASQRMEKVRNQSEESNVPANKQSASKTDTIKDEISKLDDKPEKTFKTDKQSETSDNAVENDLNSNSEQKNDHKVDENSFKNDKFNTSQLEQTKHNTSQVSEQSVVLEDDTFDIYKDHEEEEFGHKKYKPENIYVKIKKDDKQSDFLTECLKLKNDIITMKSEPEPSIESLVESFEKTEIKDEKNQNVVEISEVINSSSHVHRHLLATMCKSGKVCIWTKTGKFVSSCVVYVNFKNKSNRTSWSGTLCWYKPEVLLLSNAKSELLECNPLEMDCKSKLEWKLIHSHHKRGLFTIATGAPKVQTPDVKLQHYPVWTSAQDRSMVQFSMEKRESMIYNTCAGYVYSVEPCPYDDKRVALGVGDGAVRVIDFEEKDDKLAAGHTTSYWQNVQGKVLAVAWHSTREGLLAFGTAEGRIGLIDTNGKCEKPAKVLRPTLSKGVYGLSWNARNRLFACGDGELVVYNTDKIEEDPESIKVELEGKQWRVSEVQWTERALTIGGNDGEVGILTSTSPFVMVTAAFPFKKTVHCIAWHPKTVSLTEGESPYKNWIAANSTEKHFVILELAEKPDGSIKLSVVKTLSGHTAAVIRLVWSPHRNGQLISTSQDATVRVWDVIQGVCTAIFTGHDGVSLGAAWCARPDLADWLMSAGGDHTLKLWNCTQHPPELAIVEKKKALKPPTLAASEESSEQKILNSKDNKKTLEIDSTENLTEEQMAVNMGDKTSRSRSMRSYLFPLLNKQLKYINPKGIRILYEKHTGYGKLGNSDSKTENFDLKSQSSGKKENTQEGKSSNDKEQSGEDIKESSNDKEQKRHDNKQSSHDKDLNGLEKGQGDELKNTTYDLDFVKIFGSIDELRELLDMEQELHLQHDKLERWIIIGILRGEIDKVFQFAAAHDILTPFLIGIAPSVSHKFWKDSVQSYLAQMDRIVAANQEEKPFDKQSYGGPKIRKIVTLLSMHDINAAVNVLLEERLHKEAYILTRIRHMDSIAKEVLNKWANFCIEERMHDMAAICNIVLGNLVQAATSLSKTDDPVKLLLAAEIAKATGQETFADSIQEKHNNKIKEISKNSADEILKELPKRLELHLRMLEEKCEGERRDLAKSSASDLGGE